MNKVLKYTLIGAGLAVVGYQVYKRLSKPKNPPVNAPKKSNADGEDISGADAFGGASKKKMYEGMLKYDMGLGKVFKLVGTGFDARWIMLNEKDQPKPMDWYNLNGKWVWTKWNGQLDVKR